MAPDASPATRSPTVPKAEPGSTNDPAPKNPAVFRKPRLERFLFSDMALSSPHFRNHLRNRLVPKLLLGNALPWKLQLPPCLHPADLVHQVLSESCRSVQRVVDMMDKVDGMDIGESLGCISFLSTRPAIFREYPIITIQSLPYRGSRSQAGAWERENLREINLMVINVPAPWSVVCRGFRFPPSHEWRACRSRGIRVRTRRTRYNAVGPPGAGAA